MDYFEKYIELVRLSGEINGIRKCLYEIYQYDNLNLAKEIKALLDDKVSEVQENYSEYLSNYK